MSWTASLRPTAVNGKVVYLKLQATAIISSPRVNGSLAWLMWPTWPIQKWWHPFGRWPTDPFPSLPAGYWQSAVIVDHVDGQAERDVREVTVSLRRMYVGRVVSPVEVAAVGGPQSAEVFLLSAFQLHVVVESTVTWPPATTRCNDDHDQDGDDEYGQQANRGDQPAVNPRLAISRTCSTRHPVRADLYLRQAWVYISPYILSPIHTADATQLSSWSSRVGVGGVNIRN